MAEALTVWSLEMLDPAQLRPAARQAALVPALGTTDGGTLISAYGRDFGSQTAQSIATITATLAAPLPSTRRPRPPSTTPRPCPPSCPWTRSP